MRKETYSLLFIIITSLLFFGCKKKAADTNPPTAEAFKKLMDDGFNSLLQTATFDASNSAYTYTSPKGTKVTIDGTCLRYNGNPVSGQVTLEFLEVYNRKDMLIANVHTIGGPAKYTGYDVLLESGGIYYVCVKQNGVALTTNCKVQITAGITEANALTNTVGFDGTITPVGLRWQLAAKWNVTADYRKAVYKLPVSGFGWFNCAAFINFGKPLTSIAAYVPTNYANVSEVYVMPKFFPKALGIAYGSWPIGIECYFIFVTEKDGKYRWIIRETTIAENHVEYFNSVSDAQTGSRDEFLYRLSQLM